MTQQTSGGPPPVPLPDSIYALCQELEARGIPTWLHGEELLRSLRPAEPRSAATIDRDLTRAMLCEAETTDLLAAFPRAVVTASHARRLTLATAAGPVDLLAVGDQGLEARLLEFGLSALAIALRPADGRWCDPTGARSALVDGLLAPATITPNVFQIAPRRYWIAARLLSEHGLDASPALLDAAREALPRVLEKVPQGAPARREIGRILASSNPRPGLAFLREAGVSAALFPGMNPSAESMISNLGERPAGLRWLAWLHGSSIQRALVRLRMPTRLAKSIERLQRAHPLDHRVASVNELGIRKILNRLDEEEIAGLLAWLRLELAAAPQTEQTRRRSKRVDDVEIQLTEARAQRDRSGRIRMLAVDGQAVMSALGTGPGPHVGRALAHLAKFVEADPSVNERQALEAELQVWAGKNRDAIR